MMDAAPLRHRADFQNKTIDPIRNGIPSGAKRAKASAIALQVEAMIDIAT
jgi:hypothetical protein